MHANIYWILSTDLMGKFVKKRSATGSIYIYIIGAADEDIASWNAFLLFNVFQHYIYLHCHRFHKLLKTISGNT